MAASIPEHSIDADLLDEDSPLIDAMFAEMNVTNGRAARGWDKSQEHAQLARFRIAEFLNISPNNFPSSMSSSRKYCLATSGSGS